MNIHVDVFNPVPPPEVKTPDTIGIKKDNDDKFFNVYWAIPYSYIFSSESFNDPSNIIVSLAKSKSFVEVDTGINQYRIFGFIDYNILLDTLNKFDEIEFKPHFIVFNDSFKHNFTNFYEEQTKEGFLFNLFRFIRKHPLEKLVDKVIKNKNYREAHPNEYMQELIEQMKNQIGEITCSANKIHDNYKIIMATSDYSKSKSSQQTKEALFMDELLISAFYEHVVIVEDMGFGPESFDHTSVDRSCKNCLDYLVK